MTDAHSLVGADPDRLFADRIAHSAAALVKADPTGGRFNAFKDGLAHQGLLTRPAIAERLHPFLMQFAKLPRVESLTSRRARFAAEIESRMAAYGYFTDDDARRLGMSDAEIAALKLDAYRASGAARMAA